MFAAMIKKSSTGGAKATPANHRTVDRVTQIVEEVVAQPGITFSEIARTLGAAKSSVHGFLWGLVARGWLVEQDGGFYVGPAVYALTLASGNIRAGAISFDDLKNLHEKTGAAAFLGVRAGDHLVYVAEIGNDPLTGFIVQTEIRRPLLRTAGGKALLAEMPQIEMNAFLRRRPADEAADIDQFLSEYRQIKDTGLARNYTKSGTRMAIATPIRDRNSEALGAVILVGQRDEIEPRAGEIGETLLAHVAKIQGRMRLTTDQD